MLQTLYHLFLIDQLKINVVSSASIDQLKTDATKLITYKCMKYYLVLLSDHVS